MSALRVHRAGESIEDYCRACKTDRTHTIIVVDGQGLPIRVTCDYCQSQHNYRGGPRLESLRDPVGKRGPGTQRAPVVSGIETATLDAPARPSRATTASEAFPLVSDRERVAPRMPTFEAPPDLELLLRRIIREEAGITPVAPAPKWRGGTLVLRPSAPGLQERSWPIDTFFHKVVMLRNRLRTLEQQVNASELPDDVKVKLQAYVSGCYGSLTSFNVLFAEEDDQFKGSGGE